jgi:ribosomal protein S18 acetylase RimI-like enzyme
MLPERATTADYNAIIDTLADYWGVRDMRARHHPMFVHEFGETSLVMRDGDGGVAAYLFGFVAPTQVGYVHLVGVRADSRRVGLGRRLYGEFETLARHRGATALKAISIPTNDGSIAFHRGLGMSVTEAADYSGQGQPRIVFWRDLA